MIFTFLRVIVFNLSFVELYGHQFRSDYVFANTFDAYYNLHSIGNTWHNARLICEAEGTELYVPMSLDETENLKLFISNMKSIHQVIFVGIHNTFSKADFIDIKGKPMFGTYADLLWHKGYSGNDGDEERCLVMTRDAHFDDKSCDDVYPFLCGIKGADIQANPECDNFDLKYKPNKNGKCYKFHEDPLSWNDAYMICQYENAHLVIINSQEEANLIISSLKDHPNSKAPDMNLLHLGFSDLMFPFQYRTINGQTLKQAGFELWSPLKESVPLSDTQRCGAITNTGFLTIVECEKLAMFICETETLEKKNGTIKRSIEKSSRPAKSVNIGRSISYNHYHKNS